MRFSVTGCFPTDSLTTDSHCSGVLIISLQAASILMYDKAAFPVIADTWFIMWSVVAEFIKAYCGAESVVFVRGILFFAKRS